MKTIGKTILYSILASFIISCSNSIEEYSEIDNLPAISPDYYNITIPYNIAPLNFKCTGTGTKYHIEISGDDGKIELNSSEKVQIPISEWKELLEKNKGKSLKVQIFAFENESWKKYSPFDWKISEKPIDPYLVYRLIEPGYVGFNEMGIYQRDIETFKEKPIITNDITDRSCMNCHIFCAHDPKKMLFHIRLRCAGTIIVDGDLVKKLDTKTESTIGAGTYPAWHPSGKYVVFSVNKPQQSFHIDCKRRAEISDIQSDIVMLDIEKNEIFSDPILMQKNVEETFPSFTPDGKKMIFSAYRPMPEDSNYSNIKYSLCSVDFDINNKTFGKKIDTLISSDKIGKTVSFANASPDGKYILCSIADNGIFTSWNKESDLYLYHIETGELVSLTLANSNDSESYNSWSSNSSWVVFSSRRMDTQYNRPHITYIDEKGNSTKSFVLPQKDPDFYTYFLKSYNRPELITGPVTINPYEIEKVAKDTVIQKVSFRKK